MSGISTARPCLGIGRWRSWGGCASWQRSAARKNLADNTQVLALELALSDVLYTFHSHSPVVSCATRASGLVGPRGVRTARPPFKTLHQSIDDQGEDCMIKPAAVVGTAALALLGVALM